MIKIDYSRDELLPEFTKATLKDRYMLPDEKSPQDTFARAAQAYADNNEHAQRLYDYMSKLWFMPSTPILSNGGTDRGLPISCNLNSIHDSRQGLIDNWAEDVWLTSNGAGIGTYIGALRSSGTKTSHNSSSTGSIPFLKVIDSLILSIAQGQTRRGSVALYQDISHPEIEEFIHIRKPTGGDQNRRCINVHHGVNITDKFMNIIEKCMFDKDADDSWDLIDPHTQKVTSTISATALWEDILRTRVETGEPYLHFIDTSNRHLPKALKAKGLKITQSNLCVAPETLVLTKQGHARIEYLKDETVDIWNGTEWSSVTIRQTSEKSKLLRLTFSDGTSLDCTPYHKFYIQNSYNKNDVEIVEAKDLTTGDKLQKWELPTDNALHFVKVISVEDLGRMDATYCFTEPKANKGMFNGIVTGNCSEIILPTTSERTAVCCLSSVNLEYYDEWRNTTMVRDITRMLDNVISAYIEKAPEHLWRAAKSAQDERSLGIGAMGFHAYLQKKNIAFESPIAKSINKLMFAHIREQAELESASIGIFKGSAPDMVGYEEENNWLIQWVNGKGIPNELKGHPIRKRNTHLLAVAPNASSSIICGNTSPSIEPFAANAIAQVTLSGTNILKNKYLEKLLQEKEVDEIQRHKIWKSIVDHGGSVQHLKILTDDEKLVFKTAHEIDQRWIIEHAADRQQFIDQAQSVNLFVEPNIDFAFLHHIHFLAWKKGLKTLYYLRSTIERQIEKINTKVEEYKYETEECIACQ